MQCFCYKSPQNVDIFQQYRGSFPNLKNYSEKKQVVEKIELFLDFIKPDIDEHLRSLAFFVLRTGEEDVDLKVDDLS